MFISFKNKRKIVGLILLIEMVFSFSLVFATSAPIVNSIDSGTTGYHFANEDWSLLANVSNIPLSVNFYYNDMNTSKATLSSAGNDNYSGTWHPYTTDWCKGIQNGSSWSLPSIKVFGVNSAGSGYKLDTGYVTQNSRSFYFGIDMSFAYTDSHVNTFIGPATSDAAGYDGTQYTYNCLAYAVGCTTQWCWPTSWGSNPSEQQITDYMKGTVTRPGNLVYTQESPTYIPYADAIYYSGNHFAIVYEWNNDGSPKRIKSKWGKGELIYSAGTNPWYSGYGTAKYYFKK
jgi:hypothetical protein